MLNKRLQSRSEKRRKFNLVLENWVFMHIPYLGVRWRWCPAIVSHFYAR